MEKEFCTHEQSLAIKELGFEFNEEYEQMLKPAYYDWDVIDEPLIQQAFRFFREKYGLWYIIEEVEKSLYNFRIWNAPLENFLRENNIFWGGDYNTYEEDEQACLDKLIELARSASDSEKIKEK